MNHQDQRTTFTYATKAIPGLTTARNGLAMTRNLQLAQRRYTSEADKVQNDRTTLRQVRDSVYDMQHQLLAENRDLRSQLRKRDAQLAAKDTALQLALQKVEFMERLLEERPSKRRKLN